MLTNKFSPCGNTSLTTIGKSKRPLGCILALHVLPACLYLWKSSMHSKFWPSFNFIVRHRVYIMHANVTSYNLSWALPVQTSFSDLCLFSGSKYCYEKRVNWMLCIFRKCQYWSRLDFVSLYYWSLNRCTHYLIHVVNLFSAQGRLL